MQEQVERQGIANTFGAKFSDRLQSETLQNDDQIKKIVDRRLAGELFGLGNAVRTLSDATEIVPGTAGYVQSLLGVSNIQEATLDETERQREGAPAAARASRERYAELRERERPNSVANAKVKAQWFQNLELERVRRVQDPQPF